MHTNGIERNINQNNNGRFEYVDKNLETMDRLAAEIQNQTFQQILSTYFK
jgi:hypothetical protein